MFRNMNKCMGQFKKTHKYKWVVLDGDVDPNWIESMNTVMDDNKVLTLVSNERIPVTPSMRLIIEVSNLRNATPATVSRGGVLFINEADIGWAPYYESWKAQFKKGKTQDDIASTQYTLCLTQYVNDSFMEAMNLQYDSITPMVNLAYIMSLTTAIDHQMRSMYANKKSTEFHKNLRLDIEKNPDNLDRVKCMYECFFAYAMIWSFGAPLDESKRDFNGYLRGQCRKLPFPEGGSVYDYYYDPIENKWCNWMEKVKPLDAAVQEASLFSSIIVGTAETERQKCLLDMHKIVNKGVLYVGIAGTGKTTIVQDYFADCDNPMNDSDVLHTQCNFNSYTSSMTLQNVVQGKVEKRTGVLYGPPVGKTLIYFIDDLNMPIVDVYFTQQPIALARQLIDYGTMYDRNDLSIQQRVTDCMFVCCMNPKSGSFFVDIRMTRHLTTVCLSVPEKEILTTIYSQLIANHFKEFDEKI
jgi:dynein heavy chain, axonemal